MKSKINLYLIIFLLTASGCTNTNDDNIIPIQAEFLYQFTQDTEGWIGDFADYPHEGEDFYDLEFEYSVLPSPINETKGSLKISGNNHSDDLFMFAKKKLSGLAPDTSYQLTFNIEFASDVADNMTGVGGSPGESVYIKAGATRVEPAKKLNLSDNYYRMNIDKSNQAQSGKDMIIIGDFSNDTDKNIYTLKKVTNKTPFLVQTDSNGELWILVGTDSGFEATTTIYYNKIQVILTLPINNGK